MNFNFFFRNFKLIYWQYTNYLLLAQMSEVKLGMLHFCTQKTRRRKDLVSRPYA